MTKEQIAELRRLDADARPTPWFAREDYANEWDVYDGAGEQVVPAEPSSAQLTAAARNALPRLLEERESLLNALKEMVKISEPDFADTGIEELEPTEEYKAAYMVGRAAIAKAEAP